ncbi:hypothetical protein EBR57_02485 [bacterium]|nr:hypothetical protein [bacterium]
MANRRTCEGGFQAIQIQDFGAQVIDEFADCLTGVVQKLGDDVPDIRFKTGVEADAIVGVDEIGDDPADETLMGQIGQQIDGVVSHRSTHPSDDPGLQRGYPRKSLATLSVLPGEPPVLYIGVALFEKCAELFFSHCRYL